MFLVTGWLVFLLIVTAVRIFIFKDKKAQIIIIIHHLWQYKPARRWLRLKCNAASGLPKYMQGDLSLHDISLQIPW